MANQTKRIGDIHIPLSEVDFSISNERQRYCLEDLVSFFLKQICENFNGELTLHHFCQGLL